MEPRLSQRSRRREITPFRQEAVGRAEAYLQAHTDMPLRVDALSRMVGLSERALRDAFYSVHGMSPKQWMLAERLKELEAEDIVIRTVIPEAPIGVEYGLTDKGRALEAPVNAIGKWAEKWIPGPDGGRKSIGKSKKSKVA